MAAFRAIGAAGRGARRLPGLAGARFVRRQRVEHAARARSRSISGRRPACTSQRCSTGSWRWRWRVSASAGNHVVDRHVAAHRQAGLNAGHERGPGEHGRGHERASPGGRRGPRHRPSAAAAPRLGRVVGAVRSDPRRPAAGTHADRPGPARVRRDTRSPTRRGRCTSTRPGASRCSTVSGSSSCDLVGHSNGGRIGIVMAAEHPGRVAGWCSPGARGSGRDARCAASVRVRTYKALRADRAIVSVADGVAPQRRTPRRSARLGRLSRGVGDDARHARAHRQRGSARACCRRSHIPVLLIWGRATTPRRRIDDGQLMERLIPDAGLVVFEGAGHYAYLEQAARFCRIVEVFLRDDPERRRRERAGSARSSRSPRSSGCSSSCASRSLRRACSRSRSTSRSASCAGG